MDIVIFQIAELEFVTPKKLTESINSFQTTVKKSFKYYKKKKGSRFPEGLEDYKMNLDDCVILLCIYINTPDIPNKLTVILLSMYSIYKLDDFHFSSRQFNTLGFLQFISENKQIHRLLHKLTTDYTYIYDIKKNLEIL